MDKASAASTRGAERPGGPRSHRGSAAFSHLVLPGCAPAATARTGASSIRTVGQLVAAAAAAVHTDTLAGADLPAITRAYAAAALARATARPTGTRAAAAATAAALVAPTPATPTTALTVAPAAVQRAGSSGRCDCRGHQPAVP